MLSYKLRQRAEESAAGGGANVGMGGGASVLRSGVEQFVLSKMIVCRGSIATVPRKIW